LQADLATIWPDIVRINVNCGENSV